MMNLPDGLARIAGPVAEPTPAQVAADLARGQRALRRRRTMLASGGSVFAAAALAAAILAATGGAPAGSPSTPQAGGNQQPSVTAPAVAVTRLVAYQGEQPDGFTLDKVPQGWELQGATEAGITIAPEGFPDQNPDSFVGKITALLQEAFPEALKGKEVTVNGNKGVLTKMEDQTDGHALFVTLDNGRYLVVQVWDGLGWGEKEVLEFASGIHVGKNAKVTHG